MVPQKTQNRYPSNFAGFLIALCGLLTFARTLDNGFWGDNYSVVVHAAWVWQDPMELWRSWGGGNFRFVSQAILSLSYKLSGTSPVGFYGFVLIFHFILVWMG